MDQDLLVESLQGYMDALQAIFSWGAAIAAALYWTALRGDEKLEFVGLEFRRRDAFYVAAILYLTANVAIILLLLRVLAVMGLLDDTHFLVGYTTLAVHPWLLNPLAYLGETNAAGLSTSFSIGMLIVTWWLSATSIALLDDSRPRLKALFVPFLLVVAGNVTLFVLSKLYSESRNRLEAIAPDVYAGLRVTATARYAAIWMGIAVGIAVFSITLLGRRQHATR